MNREIETLTITNQKKETLTITYVIQNEYMEKKMEKLIN